MLIHDVMKRDISKLTSEVLKENRVSLTKKDITIRELNSENLTIADFSYFENEKQKNIQSHGHGFVDAVYKGLLDNYESEFKSLAQIRLRNFSIAVDLARNPSTASKSNVVIQFCINKNDISFSDSSSSIVGSAYENLLSAFEFYINCEKNHLMFFIIFHLRTLLLNRKIL